MYSDRFVPAPPPNREKSACYPYADPSKLKKKQKKRERKTR